MTRSQMRSGLTKVISALLAFLILFSFVCPPVSADNNSVACPVASADDISLPPTIEEYREMYGDTPPDVIDYYSNIHINIVSLAAGGSTVGDSSPSVEDCYVRKNGYWYLMPPITETHIDAYWNWLNTVDAETKAKMVRNDITADIRAHILDILPQPKKQGWWASAWITTKWKCEHYTLCSPKDGDRYGGMWGSGVTQKLYDKYGNGVETMTAKIREEDDNWLHPWTNPTLIVPNPYDYPILQAAARDFGQNDGYVLGHADCEPHLHNPHAFDSIKFPHGEKRLSGVYAQVYASSFANAVRDGYASGQNRQSHLIEEQKFYLQRIQANCACIQAICAMTNVLGSCLAAVV